LETKIGIFKIFFIPFPASTYVKNPAYNFVDFRIKRAGSSNYGGAVFGLRQKTASKKAKGKRQKIEFRIQETEDRAVENPAIIQSLIL
jgi:hypothetical protein